MQLVHITTNVVISNPAHGEVYKILAGIMVFKATFNNISVISWQSVLLVGDIGVLRENHRPAASH
jgi:hypothetical protein